ncbi:hypothetical protein GQ53DRAFT_514794 [Thozetella sp. PMI_491]|nr:hypothetical protein GQ53DRAFT_514794 [Thozetella sp. PMI_491]
MTPARRESFCGHRLPPAPANFSGGGHPELPDVAVMYIRPEYVRNGRMLVTCCPPPSRSLACTAHSSAQLSTAQHSSQWSPPPTTANPRQKSEPFPGGRIRLPEILDSRKTSSPRTEDRYQEWHGPSLAERAPNLAKLRLAPSSTLSERPRRDAQGGGAPCDRHAPAQQWHQQPRAPPAVRPMSVCVCMCVCRSAVAQRRGRGCTLGPRCRAYCTCGGRGV